MADQPPRNAEAAPLEQEAILQAVGVGPVGDDPDAAYATVGERIGELIDSLESNPDPAVGEQLDELLAAFDGLHRDALRRLAGLLAHHDLLEHAMTDPVVAMVLELYDLGPDEQVAAEPAPAPPAPMIRLQDIRRFPAATMPASAAAPSQGPGALEQALVAPGSSTGGAGAAALPRPAQAQPQVSPPPVHNESARPAAPVTDESGTVVPSTGPAEWTTLFAVEHAEPGQAVASADGEVVICNIEGVLHALRNRCGATPLPLHFGAVVAARLSCPWHRGCEYDLESGESSSGRRTVVYPVRVDSGRVRVALNHGRSSGPLQPSGLRGAPM